MLQPSFTDDCVEPKFEPHSEMQFIISALPFSSRFNREQTRVLTMPVLLR